MSASGAGVFLLLGVAFVAANLPFLFERVLFVWRQQAGDKAFGWRLLELVALYFAVGGLARLLEIRSHGTAYAQGWEFYAVTGCLFLVFAFPGFVYRYLWRRRPAAASSPS